jgi:chloramphenicol-sensitive protein RarD
MMATSDARSSAAEIDRRSRDGFFAGLGSYLLWGFLPLLFHWLERVEPPVVVADRTLCSLVLVGIGLSAARRWQAVGAVPRDRRLLLTLLVSALLLAVNWLIYVWAIGSGQALEASFGYFVNPLLNVALGMLLLGERQNRWQAVAIGIGVVALLVQAAGLGRIPYIALGLALTFGFYGFVRKTARVGSAAGLFVETLMLAPLAIAYLAYTFWRDGGIGPHADPGTLGLLLLTGPATALPLLFFAFAVQRLRLTTIGMLQYVGPTIQFLIAVFALGETPNALELLSFVLIWISLAVYTADSVVRSHRPAISG